MEIEVTDITAFDNVNGKGILASVGFVDYEDPQQDVVVHLRLPLNKEASLADIEAQAIATAKQRLKDIASGF